LSKTDGDRRRFHSNSVIGDYAENIFFEVGIHGATPDTDPHQSEKPDPDQSLSHDPDPHQSPNSGGVGDQNGATEAQSEIIEGLRTSGRILTLL
jgi:hypothetical protein